MIQILVLVFMFVLFVNYVSAGCDTDYLNNNIYAYYKLEENALTYDDEILGHNFTAGDTPDRVAGYVNFGQDFNEGNSDNIYTPVSSDWESLTEVTVAGWIKPDTIAAGDSHYMIDLFDYVAPNRYGFLVEVLKNNGSLNFQVNNGNANYEEWRTKNAAEVGKWSHFAFTFDSGTGDSTGYFNGTQNGAITTNNVAALSYKANDHFLQLSDLEYAGAWRDDGIDGTLDEIEIFNVSLNATCISHIMENTYPYSTTDTTPPTFPYIYPDPYNHTTTIAFLSFNTSEETKRCHVNISQYVLFINLTPQWVYSYNGTPADGNYSYNISCVDLADNNGSTAFWVYKDTVLPTVTIGSPEPNVTYTTDIWINLSYFDTQLYKANTTMIAPNGSIIYTNYSGQMPIGDTWYNISHTFTMTGRDNGVYTMILNASDRHTSAHFNEILDYDTQTKNGNTKYTYHTSKGDIEFTYPSEVTMYTIQTTDRWLQAYNYTEELDEIEIEIEADEITYIPDSKYPCHLIIYDKYWYDCEGLNWSTIEYTDNHLKIKYYPKQNGDITESLGGLNFLNYKYNFTYSAISATCKTCLNTSLDCSINWLTNSTAWRLCNTETDIDNLEAEKMEIAFMIGMLALFGGLLYFAFKVNEVHFVLRFFLVSMVFILLPLFGNVMMKITEATVLSATGETFFKVMTWLQRLYFIYVTLYLFCMFVKFVYNQSTYAQRMITNFKMKFKW